MSNVAIFTDSVGRGRCRSCEAPIFWAELTSGRRIPFDADPVGTHIDDMEGRQVMLVDTGITPTHFQTCPEAAKWRRRK